MAVYQFVIEFVLFYQCITNGALLDKKFVIGKDFQNVIKTATFYLSPIVVTGSHKAIPLLQPFTPGSDGSVRDGNRARAATGTGLFYFRAKKRYCELLHPATIEMFMQKYDFTV
jgi:hypothetical protein